MILELQVRNISLIPELVLRAQSGLTAITGETGAGKSILLGALSLVLGERASADVIRTGCESASVEALFDIARLPRISAILEEHGLPLGDEQTLLVKREISRTGRGKCWVNGGLSTLAVLEELGQELVDLHGQHEHQSLLHRSRQQLQATQEAYQQAIGVAQDAGLGRSAMHLRVRAAIVAAVKDGRLPAARLDDAMLFQVAMDQYARGVNFQVPAAVSSASSRTRKSTLPHSWM